MGEDQGGGDSYLVEDIVNERVHDTHRLRAKWREKEIEHLLRSNGAWRPMPLSP